MTSQSERGCLFGPPPEGCALNVGPLPGPVACAACGASVEPRRAGVHERAFDPTLRLLAEALLRQALHELTEKGGNPDLVMNSLGRAWQRQCDEVAP